jgi:hypothetical protein
MMIWTHLTCALFTPEVFFANSHDQSKVSNIENIEKKRFLMQCQICR